MKGWDLMCCHLLYSLQTNYAKDGHTALSPALLRFSLMINISHCGDIITYALLEGAIRPDIQPKSSRSHEAEQTWIWMTEGGYQAGLHFPTGA